MANHKYDYESESAIGNINEGLKLTYKDVHIAIEDINRLQEVYRTYNNKPVMIHFYINNGYDQIFFSVKIKRNSNEWCLHDTRLDFLINKVLKSIQSKKDFYNP